MKTVQQMIMLAVVSLALAGCASVGTSTKGREVPIEKATYKFIADVKDGGYKVVGTEELKRWIDEGKKMTIISALTPTDDQTIGKIPGAVNGVMPKSEKELTQADKDNLLKVAGPDKDKPIVIYCGFIACRRSHIGAKILVDNGYQNVYRFGGGTTAWGEMKYPLVK